MRCNKDTFKPTLMSLLAFPRTVLKAGTNKDCKDGQLLRPSSTAMRNADQDWSIKCYCASLQNQSKPADFESYIHPTAEELNTLAICVPGVTVAGKQGQHTLEGYLLHISTDVPAGDKLLNATGHNGHQPNRFRAFSGVYFKSHTYYL